MILWSSLLLLLLLLLLMLRCGLKLVVWRLVRVRETRKVAQHREKDEEDVDGDAASTFRL